MEQIYRGVKGCPDQRYKTRIITIFSPPFVAVLSSCRTVVCIYVCMYVCIIFIIIFISSFILSQHFGNSDSVVLNSSLSLGPGLNLHDAEQLLQS